MSDLRDYVWLEYHHGNHVVSTYHEACIDDQTDYKRRTGSVGYIGAKPYTCGKCEAWILDRVSPQEWYGTQDQSIDWIAESVREVTAAVEALPDAIREAAERSGIGRTVDPVENHLTLFLHLVSEHAAGFLHGPTLTDLIDLHEHEHDGPGTIRNHPRTNRYYEMAKVVEVLANTVEMG